MATPIKAQEAIAPAINLKPVVMIERKEDSKLVKMRKDISPG